MMRILAFSDLHLDEEPGWTPPSDLPDYDVVVAAGDLTRCPKRSVEWLAAQPAFATKPVVFVPGNGEFYDGVMEAKVRAARAAAAGTNVLFLCGDSGVIDGVAFIGSTLWTDLAMFGRHAEARGCFDDYLEGQPPILVDDGGRVRQATSADILDHHRRDLGAIEDSLARYGDSSVVVTHHAPHANSLHPSFGDDISCARFASNLSVLIEEAQPALWIHGHTHNTADYQLHGTRVVSNPKGFGTDASNANLAFDARLLVVVD